MTLQLFIRSLADITGRVWCVGILLAILIICFFQLVPSFDRGTILTVHGNLGRLYMLATVTLPGYFLVRWARSRT